MENNEYKPMTIGDWVITFLLTMIPIIGFILVFVWAFSGQIQHSKKTWAQATLIMMVIPMFLILSIGGAAYFFSSIDTRIESMDRIPETKLELFEFKNY